MGKGTVSREALTLQGPAGSLEALLDLPAPADFPAVAVVCHPHPLHQGTMLNKVVHTIGRAFNELGLPVLRFNFRGVAASEGAYGDGYGEQEDLAAAATWCRTRFAGRPLWLAGFSFGAAVAIRAAAPLSANQLVSVAPPVSRMAQFLEDVSPPCAWLIVQGESDEVVDCRDVREWAEARPERPDLVLLPDVGHFFHGRLTLLRQTLEERLRPAVA